MRAMNEQRAGRPLEGRVAIITGGAGAIGYAIAHRLSLDGARVAVADLNQMACQQTADEIAAQTGGVLMGVALDVTDRQSVEEAANAIEASLGVCDAIVPNAGILHLESSLTMDDAAWARVLEVNLTGAFITATTFARRLVYKSAPGTIVFSSSLFGLRGGATNAAYSASKFGIIGLSQSMAADLASASIRVNAVCPGQIDTGMLRDLFRSRAEESGRSVDDERTQFEARIPLGSLGTVDQVANAYSYFSSDASAYVTGQHLIVDGGWQVG